MSDVAIGPANEADVRRLLRRRAYDDTGLKLALDFTRQGTVWTATDQGEPIGIAVAHATEDERFIGDLFVEPSYRGQGIGTAMLDAALADDADRTRSAMIDASDPIALALTLRQGLTPIATVARLAGSIPREDRLAAMAAGDYRFEVETIDHAHEAWLGEFDRRIRGSIRPVDHAAFVRSARGNGFWLNGEFVGYAYAWPNGRIGPIACASEAYLTQIFAYALVTLQRTYSASWCTLLAPGSNRRIARAALRAGLRIEEILLFTSASSLASFSTYVGFHRLLF